MSFAADPIVQFRSRSWLFTPATKPDRFANARKNGADVLIVDLEDAVAPELKQHVHNDASVYLEYLPAIRRRLGRSVAGG